MAVQMSVKYSINQSENMCHLKPMTNNSGDVLLAKQTKSTHSN